MKFEHLLTSRFNNKKYALKKSYFRFEIKSITFLNLNLKNVLYLKPNSDVSLNNPVFENYKNNFFFLIVILFLICFFILILIDQNFLNFKNTNLLLIIESCNSDFSVNKYFKDCNLFFNDLLINIIQKFE